MGTKRLHQNPNSDVTLLVDLVGCLERILENRGVPKRETPQSVWSDFAAQSSEQRASTIKNLTEYLDILQYAEAQTKPSKHEAQLLWHVIKYLGLVPPEKMFERITDNDFIEIYNAEGIQIYRSLEFCKIVSYSIAEMSVYRWDQLYHRQADITNLIIAQGFQKGFSGIKDLFKLEIPIHRVEEVFGGRTREYELDFGYLSPLTDKFSKGVTHVLSTSKISLITPQSGTTKRSA